MCIGHNTIARRNSVTAQFLVLIQYFLLALTVVKLVSTLHTLKCNSRAYQSTIQWTIYIPSMNEMGEAQFSLETHRKCYEGERISNLSGTMAPERVVTTVTVK